MRLRTLILSAIAFAVAAVAAWGSARIIARSVEERSVMAVREALIDNGHDWARIVGDGLQIVIEGEAPTEAQRFRAISAAGTVVDASRVIDNMHVTESAGLSPPEFSVEILRNDGGVSLVGLVPAVMDREALGARAGSAATGQPVADLLQSADYPVPEGWNRALDLAMTALARLPRAKISVTPGRVEVTATAQSREERRRIETDLRAAAPQGVRLALDISAPRPVIAPFTLRFVIDDNGARFDACAADSEASRDAILAAATAAGVLPGASCIIGLGTPSSHWGEAAVAGIRALAELGAGTLTISNTDVALVGEPGSDPERFEQARQMIEADMPSAFSLAASLPDAVPVMIGPPEFSVTVSDTGATLRGRLGDAMAETAVRSLAEAEFGAARVTMATRITPEGLPAGWPVRVLAGIEALGHVTTGNLRVQPDRITLSGRSGEPDAHDTISRLLIERLGQAASFTLDVTYDEALDPAAALLPPEECLARIRAVTDARKITFDPGSATISGQGMQALDGIADILRNCDEAPLLIAGYTDSQGREETNLRLSQNRAEAVLNALLARRVPVSNFEARGYGEADPIADNGTEEGREANRRIEFRLNGGAADEGVAGDADAAGGGPDRPGVRLHARPDDLDTGAGSGG
ncbi:MAG: OmpA family protein [Rubellimicrobium sp.]|nr:OmpA family protein [Rubellimicrobium sp.]